MQYQQSWLDKARIKFRRKEVLLRLVMFLALCCILILYKNEFNQLFLQATGLSILIVFGSIALVWIVPQFFTQAVRLQYLPYSWVVFALFDKGKFVTIGKEFVLRNQQEAINFLMPRDWRHEAKETTVGRSVILKVKGLSLKVFCKVTLHFSQISWQGIYDLCQRSDIKPTMTNSPFVGEIVYFDFGNVIGSAMDEIFQTRQFAMQRIVDEYMATSQESSLDLFYQNMADCLDTSSLRFSGVEKVKVEILQEEDKGEPWQCPCAR